MTRKRNSQTDQPQNGSKKLSAPSVDSKNGLMKVPKAGMQRKAGALRRLKVTLQEIQQCPPLTPIFGTRSNVRAAIDSLRFSIDPVAAEFLKVYDQIPVGDLAYLWDVVLEVVALKAKVNFNEFLGAMILSYRSVQAQKSGVMAISEHPSVLKSTIQYAKLPGGERDRRMLHEAVGFVPTPKGMSLNLTFPQSQGDKKPVIEDESSPDVNEVFPMITDTQQNWQENRQKALTAKN